MNLKDIFPKDGRRKNMYCEKCGNSMILTYSDFSEEISGVTVSVEELVYLLCENCNIKYLSDHSRFAIIHLHQRASEKYLDTITSKRNKNEEDFGFTKVPFIYDPDDYYHIPGLAREDNSGFLTPVFFNKPVLLKFQNHNDYRVRFVSKTYGSLYKGNDFDISFGINKSNKVIMWLGDIATLSENEQYYLRSENIESNHDIGSEFYDGQIEIKFTDCTPEDKLINARSNFLEFCHNEFSFEISHLNKETLESISNFNPPILHTEKEQKDIIDLLNKINIESLDSFNLSKKITELGGNPDKLGSLKKIELLFKMKFSHKDISKIISPLFVLYDMRINLFHAISNEQKMETMKSICSRLDITESSTFDVIYPELLKQLTTCYEELTISAINDSTSPMSLERHRP